MDTIVILVMIIITRIVPTPITTIGIRIIHIDIGVQDIILMVIGDPTPTFHTDIIGPIIMVITIRIITTTKRFL